MRNVHPPGPTLSNVRASFVSYIRTCGTLIGPLTCVATPMPSTVMVPVLLVSTVIRAQGGETQLRNPDGKGVSNVSSLAKVPLDGNVTVDPLTRPSDTVVHDATIWMAFSKDRVPQFVVVPVSRPVVTFSTTV